MTSEAITNISKLQRKIDEINAKCGFSEPEFIKNLQTFPETMKNENIYKAEREYSDKSNSPIPIVTDNAFRAGAEWMETQMQSEIDELREALEEATRWNFGVVKAANEMGLPGTDVTAISRTVLKVTKLLEKYGKK